MLDRIKNRLRRNEGYSLVEMIIVIAMMAILAGLAAVTISSISTAKATSAKESFNDALSSLLTYTKAQNGSAGKAENGEYAMLILKTDTDEYTIKFGYSENGSSFSQDGSIDEIILDRSVIYYNSSTSSSDMGTELSALGSSVTVTDASGSTTGETGWIIKYNKSDGSVKLGAGVYTFCKRSSTNSVGKVTLNESSGSHYTGS